MCDLVNGSRRLAPHEPGPRLISFRARVTRPSRPELRYDRLGVMAMRSRSAASFLLVCLFMLAACQDAQPAGPTNPIVYDRGEPQPVPEPAAPPWPLVQVDPAVADLAAALLPPGLAEINVVSPEIWTNHGIDPVNERPVWYFGTEYAALPVDVMGSGYGVHGTIWPDAPTRIGPDAPVRTGPAAPVRTGPVAPVRTDLDTAQTENETDFVRLGPTDLPQPRRFFLRSYKPDDAPPNAVGEWLDSPEGRRALAAITGPARVSVVGDVMLARGVETRMREHGSWYPWEHVRNRLQSADLVIGNLESPISDRGTPLPGKEIWFRAAPQYGRTHLLNAVTLANNHILDYDTDALLDTFQFLRQSSTAHAGAGRNIAEARKPAILNANGVRVALLSYSEFADLFFSYDYPRSFRATETVAGVAPMELDLIVEDITLARAEADIVMVALHWGVEYMNVPEPWQAEFARALIDGGADVIIGQHPHAVQGFERYKNGLIFYSFGNFIMDQYDPVTRESLIADLWLTPDGIVGADIVPVYIDDFRPVIATGEQREQLWQRYLTYSSGIP